MFGMALADRPAGQNDITPYWIFEDGPARIERRIPLIPFSREVGALRRLKRDLAAYRMVFGQPRQEDLLASLDLGAAGPEAGWADWLITLSPPGPKRAPGGPSS
jgi:hypothetical protein